ERGVLGGGRGARRRRTALALVGLAVLLGVGGIAFLAGRTDSGVDRGQATSPVAVVPAAPTQPVTTPTPPPVEARVPAPPEPPAAAVPPGPPGFLVVKAPPWGKLFVAGKFAGAAEG